MSQVSVEDGLRQRIQSSGAENEDFDALLKHNQNMQEKIAENMLLMTNTIKEHAMTANTIIRKDIGYLEKADKVIDNNEVKLKKEALKLGEHTKSTWRCWVWVMVAFVIAVFFSKNNIFASTYDSISVLTFILIFRHGALHESIKEKSRVMSWQLKNLGKL